MTWAQNSAKDAERDKQRQREEQKNQEHRQKQRDVEAQAVANDVAPMVMRLLDEAGEALFERGGLFGTKQHQVTRRGFIWEVEHKHGLVRQSDWKARYVQFYGISVELIPPESAASQYCFHVEEFCHTKITLREIGEKTTGNDGVDTPGCRTRDLSEAALKAELQKHIYSIRKMILERSGK